MDYGSILTELQQASSFELFRLQAAINQLLDDPARLCAIKRRLKVGMELRYFETGENRLIPARLLQIRKTRVLVQELETGKRWTIPLVMINIDHQQVDITPRKQGVDRLSLHVGERVGFTGHGGEELFGRIIKLNPRRAKVQTNDAVWTVYYESIFTVIDGETEAESFIQGELISPEDD